MINRQQALEIIEKFDFFQGQRAGRELWADKPKEVQEDDLIHFQVDCELLKEFIESQTPADQWIPCSERLPDESNAYEVTMIGSDNKRYTMMLYYSDECKAWASRSNVIAWRERLEPYKGVE